MFSKTKIQIPLTVPWHKRREYKRNFIIATRGTGRLFMFACDQKVEHLNDDFAGRGVTSDMADPEYFFKIGKLAKVGVLATQLGLVARYGGNYPHVPYIIKLNSKSHLIKIAQKDPLSHAWYTIDEVIRYKHQSRLPIVGVGYTVYLGSWYETEMFKQAAQVVFQAHQQGLLAVLWMYPRGKAVADEKDPHLIAGGAGVACALGADFVKLRYPEKSGIKSAELLKESVVTAGRCGVICVGGPKKSPRKFLQDVYEQIHIAQARGAAVGRNIWQRPLDKAVRMANALSAIIYSNASVMQAYRIYFGKKSRE